MNVPLCGVLSGSTAPHWNPPPSSVPQSPAAYPYPYPRGCKYHFVSVADMWVVSTVSTSSIVFVVEVIAVLA